MDALIDTNVLITYVTQREDPYLESSNEIIRLCSDGSINGYLAFHSLSTVWYVLRKYPESDRREWISQIVNLLTVVGADNDQVREAVEMTNFPDFEDCLQYECAKTACAEYIITGNIKDYSSVQDIRILNPDQAVELLK